MNLMKNISNKLPEDTFRVLILFEIDVIEGSC